MVPFGVPEAILEKSDLVRLRIKRYLRPAWNCLGQACKRLYKYYYFSTSATLEEHCRVAWPGQGK